MLVKSMLGILMENISLQGTCLAMEHTASMIVGNMRKNVSFHGPKAGMAMGRDGNGRAHGPNFGLSYTKL